MKRCYLTVVLLILFSGLMAQSVGIGTESPDTTAVLDLQSTRKGLLIPRMTTAERKAILRPAKALLVYQTDSIAGFYYNTGDASAPSWQNLASYDLQQNINTNGHWVSGDGSNSGLFLKDGLVGINTDKPDMPLTIQAKSLTGEMIGMHNQYSGNGNGINFLFRVPIEQNFRSRFEIAQSIGTAIFPRFVISDNGNVGINTTNPQAKLEVNGSIALTGTVIGIGIKRVERSFSLGGKTRAEYICSCPTGTKLIGGGGGHRDYNSAATDIQVNYSGPLPGAESTTWRLLVYNTSSSSRAVVIWAMCGNF
jgi:hypothetical protein